MDRKQVINIAADVDRLVLESRLRDLALVAQTDRGDRVGAIAAVISKLRPGGYLIGCGPYSCGILPLTVDEVVLGRPPSPLESLPDSVADYTLNDAVWMLPREASRIHAKITRYHCDDSTVEYCILDLASTCGTFVNGTRIDSDEGGQLLEHGDVISLGPSQINTYVFCKQSSNARDDSSSGDPEEA